MGKHWKQKIGWLAIILGLMGLLSACGSSPASQPSATITPEIQVNATLQAASPTAINTSDPAITQPGATLPPVFDLTRTEDNPITDAQQIIEILEALEQIERSHPLPPGWYLGGGTDLTEQAHPIGYSSLFHVIDEELNCDLMMHFWLRPDGDTLGVMARNYGAPIHSLQSGEKALMAGARDSYACNLSNPYLYFFDDTSNTFALTVQSWLEPGPGQWGDYSYSAWFESEQDQLFFVLQESTDNMRLAYQTDPDTNEMVETHSNVEKRAYSIETGLLARFQSTATLVNDKTKQHDSLLRREFFEEMNDLPPEVLDYLEVVLPLYDELQSPPE